MAVFLKAADFLLALAKLLTILIMTAMVLSVLIGVFFRFVIPVPMAWPPEAARFLMVAVTMIASSIAIRQMDHVGITFIVDTLPMRLRGVIYIVGNLLIAAFLVIFIWYSWRMTIEMGPRQISSSLGMNMAVAYVAMPLGGLMMLVQTIAVSIEGWRRAIRQQSPFVPPTLVS